MSGLPWKIGLITVGGIAWLRGGIAVNIAVAVIACSLAFGIMVWVIKQWKHTSSK